MKKMNCCRMYLRVTSLADICSSDGKTVMRHYKMCNESTAPSMRKHSHLEWPFQRNPNDRTWKLWRNTMRKIIPTFGDRLDEPLGHWTTNEDYDKLFDSDHNKVLIYDNLQWKKYDVVSKDRRYKKLGDYEGTGIPLKTHTPITDMTNEGTFTTQKNHLEKIGTKIHHTFAKYISKLAKWQRQLIYKADKRKNTEFCLALNMGDEIWICSDGGVFMKKGYYGWIATTDSRKLTRHKGSVTGNEDTMESHRTEAVGALAALLYIYHFSMYYNTRTPQIKHYCDNKVVVDRIQ